MPNIYNSFTNRLSYNETPITFQSKPKSSGYTNLLLAQNPYIGTRDLNNEVKFLASKLYKGHAVSLCKHTQSSSISDKTFESFQLLAIDVDNACENVLTIEDCLNKLDLIGLYPTIVYETPSSKDNGKNLRFRLVFVLDSICISKELFHIANHLLHVIFEKEINAKQVDDKVKLISQFIYGKKQDNSAYFECFPEKLLKLEDLFIGTGTYIKSLSKGYHKRKIEKASLVKISPNLTVKLKVTSNNSFDIEKIKDDLISTKNDFVPKSPFGLSFSKLFRENLYLYIEKNENVYFYKFFKKTKKTASTYIGQKNQNSPIQISTQNRIAENEVTELIIHDNVIYRFALTTTKPSNRSPKPANTKENKSKDAIYKSPNTTIEDIKESCILVREMEKYKERLDHDTRRDIISNLIKVRGGEKFLKEYYKKWNLLYPNNTYDMDKFKNDLTRLKIKGNSQFGCANCESFCAYKKTCIHHKNMIQTSKIKVKRIHKPNEISLQVAETERDKIIKKVLNNHKENWLDIVKLEVGLGKTRAIAKYIQPNSVMVCETHDLITEFCGLLIEQGKPFYSTPDIKGIYKEIGSKNESTIKSFYKSGLYKDVIQFLTKLAKNETEYPRTAIYLNELTKIKSIDANTIIVTTHAKFPFLDHEVIKDRRIIIDECILTKLLQVKQIKLSEYDDYLLSIKSFLPINQYIDLKKLVETEDNLVKKVDETLRPILKNLHINIKDNPELDLTINPILNAELMVKKNGIISFLSRIPFDFNKLVVLSATANIELYKRLFENLTIQEHILPPIKHKGDRIQYVNHSFSKYSFANHPERIEKINKIFDLIYPDVKSRPIITHKCYMGKLKSSIFLYLGNTRGINSESGKNISVVGNHSPSDSAIILIAKTLGYSIDAIELKKGTYEYNGFTFPAYSFTDENLRNLHFWLITSESIQATGRARTIREECKVRLFSNIPIEGFEQRLIEWDYSE